MNRKPKPRTIVYGPEWTPDGTRERYRWIENASRGLRVVGASHEILPRSRDSHTGWYLDPLGDGETVCGTVLQLPSRDGSPCYMPAVSDPYNADCYVCNFHNLTGDKEDAARWADSMAEHYAERERDFQTRESAKLAAEEAREEALEARQEAHRLARDLGTAGHTLPPSMRDVVRLRLRALRATVRERLERAATLESDPYAWLN